MDVSIIAVGRLKQGPERELAERYRGRFEEVGRGLGFRALAVHEISESRHRDARVRKAEEAAAIAARIPDQSAVVLLDGAGRNLDSAALAETLGGWRDSGGSHAVFVIGGPDGLSPELRRRARLVMAFGAATWPHQMVRVMLFEQLYRATTILAGHPYHRA
ncbi:MAG: 23S rRNA (pseudouridine(1915)-N(3))-methyltransferase RlmH [Alphaproteobacteria bacterium]|nr:23S rRNA (pseudouridine(1915)-N(3))-methyltransferase RlmH [Alphaproteobacteria bacterium]